MPNQVNENAKRRKEKKLEIGWIIYDQYRNRKQVKIKEGGGTQVVVKKTDTRQELVQLAKKEIL